MAGVDLLPGKGHVGMDVEYLLQPKQNYPLNDDPTLEMLSFESQLQLSSGQTHLFSEP